LLAHSRKISVEAARQLIAKTRRQYDDEGVKVFCDYVARAATAPAMTTVVGWAAELVQEIHAEFMEMLLPQSVYPQLAALGLSLDFGRAGRIAIPTRSRTPTIAGSFVGEGQPIPVRQGQFTAQILTPKKMAVITTWTREIDEHSIPAIEGLLRQAIQEDTAVSLDSVLLDAMPATEIRPPGLLNGVAALTPTPGGGFNALVADLKQLSGALLSATHGNVRTMAWMLNPQQKLSISLTAMPGMGAFPFKDEVSEGRLLTYPIIESATVPMGTVIATDAADFVSVGGDAPRFEVSDQATLHMEDTDPQEIVNGTPASPVRSLWQTDSLALRLIMPINWTMRRPGMVAWLQNTTW
jgi:HK97 family phage major capsid protein